MRDYQLIEKYLDIMIKHRYLARRYKVLHVLLIIAKSKHFMPFEEFISGIPEHTYA